MAFRFESLEIWHRARAYVTSIYEVTGRFPRKEDYGLTSQLNRAVNSISFNIAEGSGQNTSKAFDRYLGIAVGSTFESSVAYSWLWIEDTSMKTSISDFMKRVKCWPRALTPFAKHFAELADS